MSSNNNFYDGMPWLAFEKMTSPTNNRLSINKVPVRGWIGNDRMGLVSDGVGKIVPVLAGWIERDIPIMSSFLNPYARPHLVTNQPPDWMAAADWLDFTFPGRWGYRGLGVWCFDDPREAVQFQLAF